MQAVLQVKADRRKIGIAWNGHTVIVKKKREIRKRPDCPSGNSQSAGRRGFRLDNDTRRKYPEFILKTKKTRTAIGVKIKNLLTDKATDTWNLLSETDRFLSQINEYHQYENQMREMRTKLNSAGKAGREKTIKEVHAELVDLRRELRLLGYDLSLGKCRLVFDGFRHDDSMAEGFKRMVLFVCDDFFIWLTGDANHIELAGILEQQITRHTTATKKNITIKGKHYLWYLRTRDELVLSGADTETKEDYERLKAHGEVSSLLFLSRLKNLR
jgi:hypothetical protein